MGVDPENPHASRAMSAGHTAGGKRVVTSEYDGEFTSGESVLHLIGQVSVDGGDGFKMFETGIPRTISGLFGNRYGQISRIDHLEP
jgi:hypothetical protein